MVNQSLDIPQLLELRRQTRQIAEFFSNELTAHLATISALFNPRPVFGRHIQGPDKSTSKQADAAFEELKSLYSTIRRAYPLNLREEFDSPMELMGASPKIHPVQYHHEAEDNGVVKRIAITMPLRWALTYASWGPERLRRLIAGQSKATGHELEQCVLHTLMLYVTLTRRPGVGRLLEALRMPLSFQKFEEFGELPVAVISAPIKTFRPPDEIMVQSTEISGGTVFEEIADAKEIPGLSDPLREKLEALVS